ncbi:hypothetical protein Ciccas_012486, partial [Cichlidogyrus casuarinus]
NLLCYRDNRELKSICTWDEISERPGTLKYYVLKVFKDDKMINETQVEGNVAVLHYISKKGYKLGEDFPIKLYSVTQDNRTERVKLIGDYFVIFTNNVYYQDVMDKLAETIARNLKNSTGQDKDLRQEVAQLSLPWSNHVQKLTLILSNDLDVFAGKGGKKKACKAAHISTSRCWEFNLKVAYQDYYTFTWPENEKNAQDLSVQLRFYYEDYPDGWYASNVYPLINNETAYTESGTSELQDFEMYFVCFPGLWLLVLIVPVLLGIGFIVLFLRKKRIGRRRSSAKSSISSVGSN